MFTRKQYLNGECSHEEYYNQLIDANVIAKVRNHIGTAKIKASTDPAFNDIPLAHWDACFQFGPYKGQFDRALRERGDFLTMASMVCIAKAAAKQIKREDTA